MFHMSELRKCEIFKDNNWQEVDFSLMKKDDKFRLFESTSEPVFGINNETEFIATSDAYLNKDNIWTIDV